LVFGGGKKNPVLMCMTEGCGFKKPIEADDAQAGREPGAGARDAGDSIAPAAL